MARRKNKRSRAAPADALVPRLRAAVKVVDEAIDELARARPKRPRASRTRG